MIRQVINFLDEFRVEHPEPFDRILEVGSRDVGGGNATDVRIVFKDAKEFIGVDMEDGKNVDEIVNGHDLVKTFGKDSFDLVLCLETLEHDDKFWVTAEQLRMVCKPGGWLIITVPGPHCSLHKHPDDYWRFINSGVRELFADFAELIVEDYCWDPANHTPPNPCAVMGKGMKP